MRIRLSYLLLVVGATGAITVVFGLMALMSVWPPKDDLVQLVTPAPMCLANALGFILCGAGLLSVASGRPRLAIGGLVPAGLGVAALIEQASKLAADRISPNLSPAVGQSLPPQFTLSFALCLTLGGVALVLMSYPMVASSLRCLVLASLGSILLALAVVVLFGSLTGSLGVYGWGRRLAYQGAQASVGFQILGLGILGFAVYSDSDGTPRIPRWLALSVGIFLATTTLVHWQMLIADQRKSITRRVEHQASSLGDYITAQMQSRILAVVHLARQFRPQKETSVAEWEREASFYLSHYPGLVAIAWIDIVGTPQVLFFKAQWQNAPLSNLRLLAQREGQRGALKSNASETTVSVSRSVDLGQGAKGFLVDSPVVENGRAEGLVVAVFNAQNLFEGTLRDLKARWSIYVFDENGQIYCNDSGGMGFRDSGNSSSVDASQSMAEVAETQVELYASAWRVRVWPSRRELVELGSNFPKVILIGGLVTACAVSLAVHLAQTGARTVKKLESTNQILQAEIVERKRTEQALRQNQARLRRLAESDLIGIIVADLNGRFLETNDAFAKMVGYTRKELLSGNVSWRDLTPPELLNRDALAIQELKVSRVAKPWEKQYIAKDGSRVHILLGGALLEGSDQHCICFVLDITERKRIEDEVRREHAENQLLLTAIPSILISIDNDKKIKKWNHGAENVFGIRSNEALGKSLSDCRIGWDSAEVLAEVSAALDQNRPTSMDDVRFIRPDGKEGILGLTMNPFQEAKEGRSGLLLIGADITQRKILESQLRQAQKLESIGQLAAGIAHEINSPMQFVNSNAHFLNVSFTKLTQILNRYSELLEMIERGTLKAEMVADLRATANGIRLPHLIEEIPNAIQESLEGIQRVTKILASMKDFSHPGTGQKTPADINRAIESTITIARNEWKYVAEMVTDFDPALPHVPCWLNEFNQVILNLIVNAAHAISDVVEGGKAGKGTITIKTRPDGDWAEVRVSDTGTGIPEKCRTKIFDPFFTTKEVGKGTGQGLMIAHSVIEKHQGTIHFETEVGRGTTFIIRLPLQERTL